MADSECDCRKGERILEMIWFVKPFIEHVYYLADSLLLQKTAHKWELSVTMASTIHSR